MTRTTYLARSHFSNTEDTETADKGLIYEETRVETLSWWAKITKMLPESLYKQLEEPIRLYTVEDVQDYRPFLTKDTWSLEKIFCRPKDSRYIAIVHGPGALTRAQIRSSLMCSVIGSGLIVLLCISFLVWFRIPGTFIAFGFFLFLFIAWGSLQNTRNLVKVGHDLLDVRTNMKDEAKKKAKKKAKKEAKKEEEGDEEDEDGAWEKAGAAPSEALYLVSEYNRVNEVTELFNWVAFALEVGIFFVFPSVTLFIINWNLGVLFFIVSITSGVRHYINAAVAIEETGNIDLVGGETAEEIWKNKSRLNEIVGSITVGKSRKIWAIILGACGFGFLAIFLSAVGTSTESTKIETFTYLHNFSYPALEQDMRYPTCTLSNMYGGFGEQSTLADYTFLAKLAYRPESVTQHELDEWFGDNVAFDRQDIVDDFREQNDPDKAPVVFKLVSFPEKKFAVILIRGTSNKWDMVSGKLRGDSSLVCAQGNSQTCSPLACR
jgi:hypothetical protein